MKRTHYLNIPDAKAFVDNSFFFLFERNGRHIVSVLSSCFVTPKVQHTLNKMTHAFIAF